MTSGTHFRHAAMALAAVVLLTAATRATAAQTTQQRIHRRSHLVMPFDMSRTLHIFRMTETGGIEKVIARNPHDHAQIRLIRKHLQREAEKFQHGDYSDPARLHGTNMPGLRGLKANASRIRVSYDRLPDGAQITFRTRDLASLTAIHRWFGAQLSEHGADARAE